MRWLVVCAACGAPSRPAPTVAAPTITRDAAEADASFAEDLEPEHPTADAPPAQRSELHAVLADTAACAKRVGVVIDHAISISLTVDTGHRVTAVATVGLGTADACIVAALLGRVLASLAEGTTTITMPWSGPDP